MDHGPNYQPLFTAAEQADRAKDIERAILASGETPVERLARIAKEEKLELELKAYRARVLEAAEFFDMEIPHVVSVMPPPGRSLYPSAGLKL